MESPGIFLIAEEQLLAETNSLPLVQPLPMEPVEAWAWEVALGPAGTRDLEVRLTLVGEELRNDLQAAALLNFQLICKLSTLLTVTKVINSQYRALASSQSDLKPSRLSDLTPAT